MSTTLTIRNLEEPVKHLLRMQAARHKRSMEAEAREILTLAVTRTAAAYPVPDAAQDNAAKTAVASVRGLWQGRGGTDELMQALRGED